MLYAERHRPRGVGLAGAVHRTWAVAEKNNWQFSNPRIDTGQGQKLYRSKFTQDRKGSNDRRIPQSSLDEIISVSLSTGLSLCISARWT